MTAATTRRTALLLLAGVLLLSLNLRPAAVSVGPVLDEVRDAFGMSGATAGLLTSLPVLAFAFFGALAPSVGRAVGLHRVTLLALVAVGGGLLGRAVTGSEPVFLLLSLVAVAGMAMANVLLPSLVKLHFPDRIGAMTAAYTTALAVGLTASLALTVPVADAFGGWRTGLGLWAVLALVAALPWVGLVVHDRRPEDEEPARVVRFLEVARTPLGLAMALFFGLQSLQAYAVFGWFAQLWRDSGWSPAAAGLLVGLVAAVSIPLSLWLPRLLAAQARPLVVLLAVIGCYPVGYLGLLVAPYSLAPLWAVLVGTGCCTFPLVLTLVGLRSRTPAGTAALSAFTQSAGYLIGATGPFAVGLVHDATGGWDWPVALLLVLSLPLALVAAYVAKPRAIEDQLHR
ncbi:MFS transporter [Nocardioides sp. SOB77]|uniref:MFS transporter n=1 Tax=Nocardioides oceani TaxID=3058369 RepID=A0ABT8FDF0_9ACTN|nr:MFS transporter [Nocardioides oceani]MDN4172713.1 MFS transporter [Nocardioides oceani]